jgi:phosphoglycerate dehydrogenase-like enzyme
MPAIKLWRKTALARISSAGSAVVAAGELQGAVVGLLGWGENATVFAGHLRSFGAKVLVYSEHADAAAIRATGAYPVSLAEALAADIVSLHRGLTPGTRHFLGERELSRLRPGSVLINTARGALVEPHALLDRLRRGDIFACLDTYEPEPLPSSHPLRRLPNVFLTPHIAGGSPRMHAAAADEVIRKVMSYLNEEPTATVSSERLRTMT